MTSASARPTARLASASPWPCCRAASAAPCASIDRSASRLRPASRCFCRSTSAGFKHSRDQFALAALDFRVLHLDLLFALYPLDAHLLGDYLLLHDVGLDIIGLVGGGLLLAHSRHVVGPLQFEVALGFGLLGRRRRFRHDALLVGLRPGDRRFAHRLGALDRRVAARLLLSAISAFRLIAAMSGKPMFMMYSFLSRTSLIVNDTISRPILSMSSADVAAHSVRHHLRLLHDLLDRQLADDAAQVAFHHQPNQPFALNGVLGQQLLGCRANASRDRSSP